MINEIQNLNYLDKIFGDMILNLSELKREQIKNALSVRGADLNKIISENKKNVSIPIDLSDIIIIFEISNRNSLNNVSMIEKDDTITNYCSFNIKIIIYGNYSKTLSQILKAKFESEIIKQKMYESGIFLEKVLDINSVNEFINETVWIRNDINIEFSCRMSIKQSDKFNHFENINENSNIIKINKEE